jgi:predicted nucleic-acid-binding Zn-ribbon protein
MSDMLKCPKCGSTSIVERVAVMVNVENHDSPVNLRVDTKPDALFFKAAIRTPLDASICGQCGFTEFYARDAAQLAEAANIARKGRSANELS